MQITIGFSGPAGSGVNTAGILLAELLAKKGYHIWADKEYASIIKWDNNCFFVSISDNEKVCLTKKVDLFFAFDKFAIEKNEKIYDLSEIVDLSSVKATHKNIFTFWICLKIMWYSESEGLEWLNDEKYNFNSDENLRDFQEWYLFWSQNSFSFSYNLSQKIGEEMELMLGNELLAEGAIKAGLEFYSAYPMTPITGVIETIVKHPEVVFFQWEDEIAVAMSMLGAKYAWKRAMCGTSWGWFALMTESVWFAHQAEIWWVYLRWMRDWPSTGTPTFTAQWDLNFALNASFGETNPAVLAPSTFEEAWTMMGLAFNWADKYQHPIVILVDKQLAEWYKTIKKSDLVQVEIDRGEIYKKTGSQDEYLRYRDTESGISPYGMPGIEDQIFMTTSYEHTESWETSENPEIKNQQMQKRFRKKQAFFTNVYQRDFQAYEVINPYAERFFVTRWINRYNLEKFVKDKPEWGVIVIKIFYPFSVHLPKWFETHKNQIKELIFVEMNYKWSMEKLVRMECNLTNDERNSKISNYRKYSLYPIFLEEVESLIKK